MWFTKHSIRRSSGEDGKTPGTKKPRKYDKRVQNLLYRKSKLESTSETSAILSGFAIVALVEFSIDTYPDIPAGESVLTAYAIVSCLLVSVHLLALLMSVCILPEIKSVLHQKNNWINYKNEDPLSAVNVYVETAWLLSTGLGLFLIIIELALVFWIKVSGFSYVAAIAAIITLGLIGIPFIVFGIGFYFRIVRAKVHLHQNDLESIERSVLKNATYLNMSSVTTSTTTVNETRSM